MRTVSTAFTTYTRANTVSQRIFRPARDSLKNLLEACSHSQFRMVHVSNTMSMHFLQVPFTEVCSDRMASRWILLLSNFIAPGTIALLAPVCGRFREPKAVLITITSDRETTSSY